MSKLRAGTRIALCRCPGSLPGWAAFARGSNVRVHRLGQSATRITTPGGKVTVMNPGDKVEF